MADTTYAKTKCEITRDEFRAKAKPMRLRIEDADGNVVHTAVLEVKEFSTGSFGWQLSDKCKPCVEGRDVKCQVGLNITAIGSKELPK